MSVLSEPGRVAEPILEVIGLTKHFGGLRAVHLDLTVNAGELRCVIGPNGAGKSTFFKILSGAMRPSAGTIRFRGRDITGWDAFRVARLGLSIKFQVASVLEELTVLENLHLAAEFKFGNRDGRRRAEEMLEVVGLTERAFHPATWLSHGEKQWLEIGMASIGEPSLILLDEPTGAVDTETAQQLVDLLKTLNREDQVTIVLVTHDTDIAGQASRQIRLKDGKVLTDEKLTSGELVAN